MIKNRIYSPGPVDVAPATSLTMAHPIIHHRTKEFEAIVAEVLEGLKIVFQTRGDVILLSSSGTGVMESAIVNTCSPGDKVLCVRGGKFGERWGNIVKAYGGVPVNLDVPWGKAVAPAAVEAALVADPSIRAVCVQASETSTGAAHPVRELGAVVKKHPGTILIVDAITAVGVMDIRTDEWGLDVVVGGSQKAFRLPPGLSFAAVSEKAWKHNAGAKMPRFYFDWAREKKNLAKNTTAWTPAVSLIIGLRQVLADLRAEGIDKVTARASSYARATREAMKALGLTLYAGDNPSDSVTAVCAPAGMNADDIVKTLAKKYGITIAGGQDEAKGKIFRLSHMGYLDGLDMITCVAAVEMTLRDLGHKVELGAGVKKAQEILV
jgi:aspartate aminotransferase-like enzyme